MANAFGATIQLVVPRTQNPEGATVTLLVSQTETSESYGPYAYQFPLPAQVLADGSTIDACAPFATPGEPSNDELYDGCMVVTRFWAAQLGLPSSESDIDLTVVYPGA